VNENVLKYRLSYRVQKSRVAESRFPVWWVYFMMASYFYCLPLMRIAHVTVTDVRLYDVMFLFGFVLVLLPHSYEILTTIRNNSWLRAYILFSAWCALSLIVTQVLAGGDQAFIAAGRLTRFIGYGLVAAGIVTFVKEKEDLQRLAWLFFILIAIQAYISFLQSFGYIGQLWPSYWVKNYEDIPTGTLSLHHLQMSTLCILGASLGLFLLGSKLNSFARWFIASSVCMMAYATFLVTSRSGWLGLGMVVCLFSLQTLRRRQTFSTHIVIFWLVVAIIGFLWLGREPIIEMMGNSWQRGYESKVETGGLTNLSVTRMDLLLDFPRVVSENSWVLLSGTGIENAVSVLRYSNAMHNNYLNVIIETGLIGFLLYLNMLFLIWRRSVQVIERTNSAFGRTIALGFQVGFLALLTLNLFNEAFYMQYCVFSLTGQIMAFAAIALHPLWLNSTKDNKKPTSDMS
jgi:hypothetical protein